MNDTKDYVVTVFTIKNIKSQSGRNKTIHYHTVDGDIYSKLEEIFALVCSGLKKTHQTLSQGSGIVKDARYKALYCGLG